MNSECLGMSWFYSHSIVTTILLTASFQKKKIQQLAVQLCRVCLVDNFHLPYLQIPSWTLELISSSDAAPRKWLIGWWGEDLEFGQLHPTCNYSNGYSLFWSFHWLRLGLSLHLFCFSTSFISDTCHSLKTSPLTAAFFPFIFHRHYSQ